MIKKEGNYYILYSKDGKKLGKYKTKKKALEREKQIQYWKKD